MAIYPREDARTALPQLEKSLNQQFEELQGKIDNAQTDIDSVQADINAIQSDVTSLKVDYIVEQGESGDWTYRKWNSGRYEAEAYVNYGTVTANSATSTIEGSVKLYSTAAIPIDAPTTPHTLINGNIITDYVGNSQGYSIVMRTTDGRVQLGRLATSAFTFYNVILVHRVVNGTWK